MANFGASAQAAEEANGQTFPVRSRYDAARSNAALVAACRAARTADGVQRNEQPQQNTSIRLTSSGYFKRIEQRRVRLPCAKQHVGLRKSVIGRVAFQASSDLDQQHRLIPGVDQRQCCSVGLVMHKGDSFTPYGKDAQRSAFVQHGPDEVLLQIGQMHE
jgi:hypothetical protein